MPSRISALGVEQMSEAAHGTQPEFWRPPTPTIAEEMAVGEAIPTMAEACPRCGTEFLLGSRFCHTCGRRRPEAASNTDGADAPAMARLWTLVLARIQSVVAEISLGRIREKIKIPAWLHHDWLSYLRVQQIKRWSGLPMASLIAFLVGLGCALAALLVGLLTAKTLVDWQAIQFYRVEWLLAATASFVAGILLKKSASSDGD